MFLGDSITEGFQELNNHNNIVNLGVSGNRTLEVMERLDAVYTEKPSKLFLMIGINDYMNNQEIWFNDLPIDINRIYEYLLNQLIVNLKNTEIILFSILPVASGMFFEQEKAKVFNKEIDELNEYIFNLTEKYNLKYIDLNNSFKDSSNNMKNEYTIDGIHLTKEGYKLFYQKIFKLIA